MKSQPAKGLLLNVAAASLRCKIDIINEALRHTHRPSHYTTPTVLDVSYRRRSTQRGVKRGCHTEISSSASYCVGFNCSYKYSELRRYIRAHAHTTCETCEQCSGVSSYNTTDNALPKRVACRTCSTLWIMSTPPLGTRTAQLGRTNRRFHSNFHKVNVFFRVHGGHT